MVITDNLVSLYHANDDWNDSWGSHDGIASGAIFDISNRKLGSHSGYFDGLDDEVDMGDVADFDFGTGAFSISLWVYWNSFPGGNRTYLTKAEYSAPAWEGYHFNRNGSSVQFVLGDGSTQMVLNHSTTVTTLTWYHFVVTRDDSGNVKFYINNGTPGTDTGAQNISSANTFRIGRGSDNYPRHDNVNLDEISIWNREITSAEIARLYNGGNGIELPISLTDNIVSVWHMNDNWYDSWGHNNGTPTGALFDDTNNLLGSHSGFFDGLDDKVECSDVVTTGDAITVSAWIKLNELGAANNNAQVASKWYAPNLSWTLGFQNNNNNTPWFGVDTTTTKLAYAGSNITDTNWHHILGIYDGVNVTVYLDDVAGTPVAQTGDIALTPTIPLTLGDYSVTGNGQFKGLMDEVLIWDRALTRDEITTLHNSGAGYEIPARSVNDGLISVYHVNDDWLDSYGNNDGTPTGTTFDDTIKKLGSHSGYFDNIDDTVNLGAHDEIEGLDELTFAAWIYQTTYDAGTYWYKLGVSNSIVIQPWSDQKIYATIGAFPRAITLAAQYPLDEWFHLVVLRSGGVIKIYINTVEKASATGGGTIDITANPLFLASQNHAQLLHGYMDEINIWNRAITTEEIATLYNGGDGIELPIEIAESVFNSSSLYRGLVTRMFLSNSKDSKMSYPIGIKKPFVLGE